MAAIVAVVLVMKFYPVWVTLQNLIVLCVGGFMAGGGINKALSERKRDNVKPINKEEVSK